MLGECEEDSCPIDSLGFTFRGPGPRSCAPAKVPEEPHLCRDLMCRAEDGTCASYKCPKGRRPLDVLQGSRIYLMRDACGSKRKQWACGGSALLVAPVFIPSDSPLRAS